MKCLKEYNRRLAESYPFLIPRHQGADEPPGDYDYSWTELDAMPDGWRSAFGEQMCEEIRRELLREGGLDEYRVFQIKEKFGSLRWYDNSHSETLRRIVSKYEDRSTHTCIRCGNPASRSTSGRIAPLCDSCVPEGA